MGLKIEKPSDNLEKLMWEIWKDFEKEMKCNNVFDPINEVMADPSFERNLNNVPIISMPANNSPQFQQLVMKTIIPKIQLSNQTAFQQSALLGCIESANIGYNISMILNILAWRNFDMQIGINVTTSSSGWNKI